MDWVTCLGGWLCRVATDYVAMETEPCPPNGRGPECKNDFLFSSENMEFLETQEAVRVQPAGAVTGLVLSFSISLEAAATAVGGASCHPSRLSPTRHRNLRDVCGLDDGGTPAATSPLRAGLCPLTESALLGFLRETRPFPGGD